MQSVLNGEQERIGGGGEDEQHDRNRDHFLGLQELLHYFPPVVAGVLLPTLVIIALIVYTLTMDKLRSIATLKLVGAPDRTIVGLIVQQAMALGISGFWFGVALCAIFKDYFPRRVLMEPRDIAVLFLVVIVICLLASTLSVRAAVKVDPATALASG